MELIDVKYFKLAVGTVRKETPSDISLDCPLCNDTKSRLHMYQKSDMDMPLVRCFNAGCELEEHQGLVKFLNITAPHLTESYKKERFHKNISDLSNAPNRTLNDIILGVNRKLKVEPIIEEKTTPKNISINKLPKLFTDMLLLAKDVPEAVKYIESRNLRVHDDWLFSKEKFIKIFDKSYFVENFIFIPLWQNNKLKGFYTRCINEKRFSTIIFPGGEKYWISENFDVSTTCWIFEGILDALSSGLENTVAMLSADLPSDFLEELADPIFCLDNDETGIKKALKYNSLGHKTFIWPSDTLQKDMNSMLGVQTINDNKNLIENNIFNGLNAKVKLNISRF